MEVPEIFSEIISPIDFVLDIHNLQGGIQDAIAYLHAPVILHRMLASDWLIGFWKFSPELLALSTSYFANTTSYVGYRLLLHIIALQ